METKIVFFPSLLNICKRNYFSRPYEERKVLPKLLWIQRSCKECEVESAGETYAKKK